MERARGGVPSVGVVKRRVLRGLWRRLVGVGIIGTGLSGSGLYTVLGRALSLLTSWSAAFALPCCALRGIWRGATMSYRSPGRFLFPHPTPARVLLMYTTTTTPDSVHKKHNTRRMGASL